MRRGGNLKKEEQTKKDQSRDDWRPQKRPKIVGCDYEIMDYVTEFGIEQTYVKVIWVCSGHCFITKVDDDDDVAG